MTPIEIIALIFILLVVVKLVVVIPNPQSWHSVVKKIYNRPIIAMTVGLCMAVIILRYLLDELNIVQIFAAMTFMMALMMVQFAAFGSELSDLSEKFLKDRSIIKKAWLSIAIWIALMIWVLYEVFV